MPRRSAFRPDVSELGPGYWVFTPARLADGSIVIVNRGFVPDARKDVKTRREGEVSAPVDARRRDALAGQPALVHAGRRCRA